MKRRIRDEEEQNSTILSSITKNGITFLVFCAYVALVIPLAQLDEHLLHVLSIGLVSLYQGRLESGSRSDWPGFHMRVILSLAQSATLFLRPRAPKLQ